MLLLCNTFLIWVAEWQPVWERDIYSVCHAFLSWTFVNFWWFFLFWFWSRDVGFNGKPNKIETHTQEFFRIFKIRSMIQSCSPIIHQFQPENSVDSVEVGGCNQSLNKGGVKIKRHKFSIWSTATMCARNAVYRWRCYWWYFSHWKR